MDGRLTRTNCDEAGDYVVPSVLSPRDLVSRPDNMDKTVLSSSVTVQLIWPFVYAYAKCRISHDAVNMACTVCHNQSESVHKLQIIIQ